MFAGLGLFLSMVLTTMWISNDMARIRAKEKAEQAARCATAAPATQSTLDPAASGFDPAPTAAPAEGCATGTATGTGSGDLGGASNASTDPATGLPVDPTAAAAPTIDPVTGQPAATTFDPATGQPLPSDPSAAGFDQSGAGDAGTYAPAEEASLGSGGAVGF